MAFLGSTGFTGRSVTELNNEDRNNGVQAAQLDQNMLLKIAHEIKKSINESLEGVAADLKKQVMELHSEVACLQQASSGWGRRARLPKALTVNLATYACANQILHHFVQFAVKKLHAAENQFDPSKL